jgi:hypothetical protein
MKQVCGVLNIVLDRGHVPLLKLTAAGHQSYTQLGGLRSSTGLPFRGTPVSPKTILLSQAHAITSSIGEMGE